MKNQPAAGQIWSRTKAMNHIKGNGGGGGDYWSMKTLSSDSYEFSVSVYDTDLLPSQSSKESNSLPPFCSRWQADRHLPEPPGAPPQLLAPRVTVTKPYVAHQHGDAMDFLINLSLISGSPNGRHCGGSCRCIVGIDAVNKYSMVFIPISPMLSWPTSRVVNAFVNPWGRGAEVGAIIRYTIDIFINYRENILCIDYIIMMGLYLDVQTGSGSDHIFKTGSVLDLISKQGWIRPKYLGPDPKSFLYNTYRTRYI